ncbi:MAG TPA: ATP-binding protein, partial [Streptosporangiaceae bacterium]|nr:ATP-binding protein [Streptosporangiaceae bacterium]
ADVIHLLAELIENATTFSAASNEVTVRAERVANGFVAEIEDRGIGIGAEELVAFNDRLANPPEFDLADSHQLGLFVVARLAGKHHITVTLRRSPYGGTAAIVLIPNSIVVVHDERKAEALDVVRTEMAGNGRSLSAMPGSMLPGAGWRLQAGAAGSGAPGDSVDKPRDGVGHDAGPALPAEQTPALAAHRPGPYLPPDEELEPAASPGNGAENVVVVDSAVVAGEASPAVSGWNGSDSDYSRGSLDGNGAPSDPLGQRTAGPAWDRNPVASAGDPASAGASTLGQQEAPSASDGNARGPAWDADPVTHARQANWAVPAGDRGHETLVSPTSATPPALPRRDRQASLAPQLRNDNQPAADGQSDSQENLSPADSRALVESVQYGLDLAATTSMPADDPWPAGGTTEPGVIGEDAED